MARAPRPVVRIPLVRDRIQKADVGFVIIVVNAWASKAVASNGTQVDVHWRREAAGANVRSPPAIWLDM